MKNILKGILVLLITISCSSLKDADKYDMYKLDATIVTNKGNINLFLYPKAAPETVANFIFLAEQNFYDGLLIHRVEPAVIQGGDPLGTGQGGAGYVIKDEFDGFLKFNYSGILGMAHAGPNTTSSQFFITKEGMPILNGAYSAFGSLRTVDDLIVVKSIEKGDVIEDIIISGENKDKYLSNFEDKIKIWNEALKRNKDK